MAYVVIMAVSNRISYTRKPTLIDRKERTREDEEEGGEGGERLREGQDRK